MLFSSLLQGMFAWTEILFVPHYWNPQFRVIRLSNDFFMEDLIYTFFSGGSAAVMYQAIFRKPLFDAERIPIWPFAVVPALFLLYWLVSGVSIMGVCLLGGLALIVVSILFERRLGRPILTNGLLLASFALLIYLVLGRWFPSFPASFNKAHLSGLSFLGIPIEELMYYFVFGGFWCLLYEVVGRGRLRSKLGYFYD
jgi:hypothetical protein